MSQQEDKNPNVSLTFTGNLLQFNITVLVLAVLIIVFFGFCMRSQNPIVIYTGLFVAVAAIIALVWFVSDFYKRHKSRPLDGQSVSMVLKNQHGAEVSIVNPPDAIFDDGQLAATIRQYLVGYDENLCPVGEVVGKASEGKTRVYTDAEKAAFMEDHRAEIKGKKSKALQLVNQTQSDLPLTEPDDGVSS